MWQPQPAISVCIDLRSVITRGFVPLHWNGPAIFTRAEIIIQEFCIKFCVKLSKRSSEALEMLRQILGEDALL